MKDTKLVAIHSGIDWADACAEYLVVPEGMNLQEEYELYRETYFNGPPDKRPPYKKYVDWLISRGAREAEEPEDITVVEVA